MPAPSTARRPPNQGGALSHVAGAPPHGEGSFAPLPRAHGWPFPAPTRAGLLDGEETSTAREVIAALLAHSSEACLAVARIRLAAVDLTEVQLARVSRCRVLVGRLDSRALGLEDRTAGAQDHTAAPPAPGRPDPDTSGSTRASAPIGSAALLSEAEAAPSSRAPADTAALPWDAIPRTRLPGGSPEDLRTLLDFLRSGRAEVRSAGVATWYPDFSVYSGLRMGGGRPPGTAVLIGSHFFAPAHLGPALTGLVVEERTAARALAHFGRLWDAGYDVLPVVAETLERLLERLGERTTTIERRDPDVELDAGAGGVAGAGKAGDPEGSYEVPGGRPLLDVQTPSV